MAFKGKKVADIYAELHLDKDDLRQAMAAAGTEMGADADRAGRQLGDRMTRGIADRVEALSEKLTKARRDEAKAADAVKLAELRLSEARDKGGQKASTLLALEQRLAQANLRLTDTNKAATLAASKHADAQHRLGAEMADDIENIGKKIGPSAQKAGDDAGGKLALGMRMSIIRNSPLIVAAVGGALAAGGPVALAGAATLFAGIGIVAAAQSQKVQSAWLGTWQSIKRGAVDDAGVLETTMTDAAGRVATSFEAMRPKLREAFAEAPHQIDTVTNSLLAMTHNALPGMVRAVSEGDAAVEGFGAFLEKTGAGVSGFFDRIVDHAPAAGQAWRSLGDSVGVLLPLLGEVLGQGSELAADVLPLLHGSLSMVLSVTTALGPALPAIAKGMLAIAAARAASSVLDSTSSALGRLAVSTGQVNTETGKATGALGRTQSAVSRLSSAIPFLAIATAGLYEAFTAADRGQEDLTNGFGTLFDKLRQGGAAAEAARGQIASLNEKLNDYKPEWGGVDVSKAFRDAQTAARDYWSELDPVSRGTELVRARTNDLQYAMEHYGEGSAQAESASLRLRAAQQQLESAQDRLKLATEGVTDAMIAQADQALAGIDSTFAYRNAQNQLEDAQSALADAQAHLNDTNKDTRTTAEDVQRAQLALEEQTYRTALAFGQQQADLSGLEQGTNAYNRVVQEQTLAALEEMQKQAGPEMAAAIQKQIDALRSGGVALDSNSAQASALAQRVRDLGFAVQQVPGEKFVRIDAPTAAQIQQLQSLGYVVTRLPNGSIYVSANTADAERAINYAARARTATVHLRQVGAALAGGGSVNEALQRVTRAATGRVVGPGTGTSDSVPAMGPDGGRWALSNGEWIINEAVSRAQGDAKMAMLNAGRAMITLPEERRPPRGYAGGIGAVAERQMVSQQPGGTTIHVGTLQLVIPGAFNLGSGTDKRRLIAEIRDGLVDIERAAR